MERPNRHERVASRPPTQQDERASITALLEEIRQRRDCLSRGSVLNSNHRSGTRRISDLHGSEDRELTLQHAARGILSTATLDGAVSRPNVAITAIHEDRSPHSSVPSHKIVWVRRSIKRWHPKQNTIEKIGSVEFATVAPLASVRRLIDQFYPLPHRREYEFVYPELYVRIDPIDERNVFPAAFPYIRRFRSNRRQSMNLSYLSRLRLLNVYHWYSGKLYQSNLASPEQTLLQRFQQSMTLTQLPLPKSRLILSPHLQPYRARLRSTEIDGFATSSSVACGVICSFASFRTRT
uniref:Uncharacterized protein n=1 Tax=Globisporangium ultimum (strain ATCC 200006 / CBS 805.95 / DAOM BR144) TaxID=431595 RepID=K3XA74_GLOUD